MTRQDESSKNAGRGQAAEFRRTIAAARDRLRTGLAGASDLPALAREVRTPLIKALMAFAGHPEGSRGQAWGSLAERATLALEQAINEKDANRVRRLVAEAEGRLAQVLGDMNSSGLSGA